MPELVSTRFQTYIMRRTSVKYLCIERNPENQKQVLTQEVSVVINGAASLRLEWGLKAAMESAPREHSGAAAHPVQNLYNAQDVRNIELSHLCIDEILTAQDLGLRPDQKQVLTQEVSVVINGAASLRLEWGLKAAVESNTLGTLRVLELAAQMSKLNI
ncbi:hypothetical protein J6590_061529 [Homalodisca vitripennis]|nr:hypothetical protein J6590_061529 [Homalodisca vitripennis]